MFSETVRRSPATLPGHHHCCYFGVRAETKQCSTLVRLMSVGTVLCGAAEVGQAQPRAGSEGAELHSRWCQCPLHSRKKSCSSSSACWWELPEERAQRWCHRGRSVRRLRLFSHVTVGSLSTQSECMKHISWLCPGDPGKNAFVREQYGFISLFLSPVLSVGVRATSLLTCCVNPVWVWLVLTGRGVAAKAV